MILTQKDITNAVRDYFKDKPVKSVYLFGSYARGEANEESDVDLLILVDDNPKKLGFFEVMELSEGISERLRKKVDFVEARILSDKLMSSINKNKIALYTK